MARCSQSRHRSLSGREEPPDARSLAGATAGPAPLGTAVLPRGPVPAPEDDDREDGQRRVGPSSSQNAVSSCPHTCVVELEEREAEPCCDRTSARRSPQALENRL